MLSVIIPAYNEENAITATLEEVKKVFENACIKKYEIIVVNDSSTDNTASRAEAFGVRVLTHPHNMGYGKALKTGIENATFETIIITDADRTYPFNEIPHLLKDYEKGFDMVVGARTGAHYKESFLKYPLRMILKFLVEFTAGRKIPDINSGLRIFKKSTILPYLPTLCDTFSFTTSATLAYMMTSKFVHYRPIPYAKREGTTKVKLFRDSLRTLLYILQAMNYYNPLKVFMLFTGLCILFACMGFLSSLMFNLRSGFLLGIGGLLVALISMGFGLIADLLKQIMHKKN